MSSRAGLAHETYNEVSIPSAAIGWTIEAPQQHLQRELDAICDHALCAQYMGNAFVYLEAGSGADCPISTKVIEAVRKHIDIPLIVGGGIKNADAVQSAASAGANFVVVGTALEDDHSIDLLTAMVNSTKPTGREVAV